MKELLAQLVMWMMEILKRGGNPHLSCRLLEFGIWMHIGAWFEEYL